MLKKGDKVVMHTCGEAERYAGKIWTCRTDEQKLHEKHDYTVVWLDGFSGAFASKYLQKVDLSEFQGKISLLESSLKIYKEESDMYERSTHIDNFLYEFDVNEKGVIPCLITANGVDHSFEITEKDAKTFVFLFNQHNSTK